MYYANNLYLNGKLLTHVVVPEDVLQIGRGVFYNCGFIEDVVISNGVTSIGWDAFRQCNKLKNIIIPNSVISIGYSAFSGCDALTNIIIPDSVTVIGYSAFSECNALTSITVPFVGAIKGNIENAHLGYIFGVPDYGNIPISLKNVVVTNDTRIGRYAFEGCVGLISITISDTVTDIGYYAFKGCSSLASIKFEGTKKEWDAIEKQPSWDAGTGPYIVYCTDGEIAKLQN